MEESKRMHETKWWKSGRDGRKFKEQKIGRCGREKDAKEKKDGGRMLKKITAGRGRN